MAHNETSGYRRGGVTAELLFVFVDSAFVDPGRGRGTRRSAPGFSEDRRKYAKY
jgi:hypothetical protein